MANQPATGASYLLPFYQRFTMATKHRHHCRRVMRSGDDRLVELRPGEQPVLECGIAQGRVTPHNKELAHRAECQQYAVNRNANQDKKGQSMDPLRDDVAKVTDPKTRGRSIFR